MTYASMDRLMKTYDIYAATVGTKYIGQVEAESKERALELAQDMDKAYVSLCHQCSTTAGDIEIESFVAEECRLEACRGQES